MAEDPELERRLAAMFASARPRPAFEDELWRRIEARRPWYTRIGEQFRPVLRYAPALATLLVVVLGGAWLAGNFRGGPSAASSTTTAGSASAPGDKNASVSPAFGVLPRPGGGLSITAPQTATGTAGSSAGLAFSGTLPSLPAVLPVYRYDEPTAADRARIGAALEAGSGLSTIAVTPSDPVRGVEPQFLVNGPAASSAQAGSADAATAFLAAHNLLPPFAYQLRPGGPTGQVTYGRVFDGSGGSIRQVRPDGTSAGLTVDITGGTVSARGPLDLPLTIASYPLRPAADALTAANVHSGSTAGALDRAELVYVLVASGDHGYYEPALLLTGTGVAVLAPVITPGWLAR